MKSGAALILLILTLHSASGSFPKAQNITWKSTNFKTLLTWEPKPSDQFSYTVEFSAKGQDEQRNAHCIRTSETVCDLSASLTDPKATYTAYVISKPPPGVTSDLIDFPYNTSPHFCPYKDTNISRPDFKLEVGKDKRSVILYVTDPLTALFEGERQLSIRDVFSDELQYKVTYRRAQSSGKKVFESKSSQIELTNLDKGESYCFSVQAYIPSRSLDKQLGEISQPQCSHNQPSIFEVYSVGVIAAAIFLILLLIGIFIAVTVICCKRRRKMLKSGKEGVPLRVV